MRAVQTAEAVDTQRILVVLNQTPEHCQRSADCRERWRRILEGEGKDGMLMWCASQNCLNLLFAVRRSIYPLEGPMTLKSVLGLTN